MKQMFSISGLAAAAAIAFAGAASAADMPVKAPPPPPPAWSWTGLYSGVNVGGGWGDTSFIDNYGTGIPPGQLETFGSLSGPLGGTQTGLRVQFGALVLGAEASYEWADIDQMITPVPPGAPAGLRYAVRDIWTGTVQGGWAFDKWLIYAKGGYAGGGAEIWAPTNTLPAAGVTSVQSLHLSGWTAGAGIDYMLLQNLVVGVEYDHYDMSWGAGSSPGCPFPGPGGACGATYTQLGSRVHIDAIMARASIKGDWLGMLFR